jgi:hypothetical protein
VGLISPAPTRGLPSASSQMCRISYASGAATSTVCAGSQTGGNVSLGLWLCGWLVATHLPTYCTWCMRRDWAWSRSPAVHMYLRTESGQHARDAWEWFGGLNSHKAGAACAAFALGQPPCRSEGLCQHVRCRLGDLLVELDPVIGAVALGRGRGQVTAHLLGAGCKARGLQQR